MDNAAQKAIEADTLKENSVISQGSQARMSPSLSQSKSPSQQKNFGAKRGSDALQPVGSTLESQDKTLQTPRMPVYGRDNIELEFRPVLIKLWQDLSRNYRAQMKKIFRNVRRNREV